MLGLIISLIPPYMWILVLVVLGFAVMFGLVSRSVIPGVIITMFLLAFFGPFIDTLLKALPWWVSALLTITFFISIISWVISFVFGREAAGHLYGHILHDLFLLPFRILGHVFGGGHR